MRACSYQSLIDSLTGIDAPDEYKQQFEALLRHKAAQEGLLLVDRRERVDFARHLLDHGEDRAVIAARLRLRFEIGRTQAYADISKALETVRKSPPFSGQEGGLIGSIEKENKP